MLYVIGDLHLSISGGKKMDVFGGEWVGYIEKIQNGFSKITDDDMVVLCGDTSWGLNLREALPDFQFLESLPGQKLLIKGNHDYFWDTERKLTNFFRDNGIQKIRLLHNTAVSTHGLILCGTRGWACDNQREAFDQKIFNREMIRLERSLQEGSALGEEEKVVFLHYPPWMPWSSSTEMLDLMNQYGVRRCYYGHLHGASRSQAVEGPTQGIELFLVSGDHIGFDPIRIQEQFVNNF
jgi:predicted phosphohydrolase